MVFVRAKSCRIRIGAFLLYHLMLLREIPGGATDGTFNAHHVAFGKKDWIGFGNHFVNETLGLQRMQIYYADRALR